MDITITSATVETHEGETALVKGSAGGAYVALALSKDEAAAAGLTFVPAVAATETEPAKAAAFTGSPTIILSVK